MEGFLGTLLAVFVAKGVYEGSKSKLPDDQQKAVNQHFTKWVVVPFVMLGVVAFLISLISSAFAQQHTFRDSSGRVMGYSTTNNAGTVYRDSLGRNTGRSVTNSTGTTFYNSRGQQTGTMRK